MDKKRRKVLCVMAGLIGLTVSGMFSVDASLCSREDQGWAHAALYRYLCFSG